MARSAELVVIGGSWGGMNAARVVLQALPATFDAPVLVVLHRHRHSGDELLERILGTGVERELCEVDDKTPLRDGCVFVAPADYHLLVENGHVALSTDAPVNFSRPSIDVACESAADDYGPGLVAVVLTGANEDGAAGVRRVLDRGGRVVIQEPEDAERPEMPKAALAAAGTAAHVAPLAGIAPLLCDLVARTVR